MDKLYHTPCPVDDWYQCREDFIINYFKVNGAHEQLIRTMLREHFQYGRDGFNRNFLKKALCLNAAAINMRLVRARKATEVLYRYTSWRVDKSLDFHPLIYNIFKHNELIINFPQYETVPEGSTDEKSDRGVTYRPRKEIWGDQG